MAQLESKEVLFDVWCPQCHYEKTPDDEEPCTSCVGYFWNLNSTKPVKWKEKSNDRHEPSRPQERIRKG